VSAKDEVLKADEAAEQIRSRCMKKIEQAQHETRLKGILSAGVIK